MSTKTDFLNNYELSGSELPILTYPHPTLSKVAAEVTEFDDKLVELVKNMLYTMYIAPGVGLAAPQIGESIRMFVIDTGFDREEVTRADGSTDYELSNLRPYVFINPVLRDGEGEIFYEEGCLSLPGFYEEVKRYEKITVDYCDLDGNKQSITVNGSFAVCLQHENDHLDGKVFIDRISLLKRNMIKKKIQKSKKK